MAVVVDTNFILSVFELKVDILGQIEEKYGKVIMIPDLVVLELERLKKKTALSLLKTKNYGVVAIEQGKTVDDALIAFCKANNHILATQDRELQLKAKQQHLKILGIRQQKYIYEV